jgi:signal peptidase II
VLTLLVAGSLFFLIDQFTKLLAERHAAGERPALVAWRIGIRPVANRRRGPVIHHPRNRLLVWAALFGIISLIVLQGQFFQRTDARLGLGIALGGAGSNVWDQLRRGAVVDFLDLGCWPVFNLADLGIGIGVTTAMWFLR